MSSNGLNVKVITADSNLKEEWLKKSQWNEQPFAKSCILRMVFR